MPRRAFACFDGRGLGYAQHRYDGGITCVRCGHQLSEVRQRIRGTHVCRGCGRRFFPSLGAAGQFCTRACYEDLFRPNRSRNARKP